MDEVERIFELVDRKYKEQKDFAHDVGVTPSIVSEWRRRKSASFTKRLPQIATILGVSTNYLLTGEKKEPGATNGTELVLTQEEARFIGYLRQMTPDQRKALDEKMEFLISMQVSPPAGRE